MVVYVKFSRALRLEIHARRDTRWVDGMVDGDRSQTPQTPAPASRQLAVSSLELYSKILFFTLMIDRVK